MEIKTGIYEQELYMDAFDTKQNGDMTPTTITLMKGMKGIGENKHCCVMFLEDNVCSRSFS